MDVREIADELGVTHILEGGMRNAGNRIRVSSQLTDATSGFEEWSDVFDGESDDWFMLQAEMAVRIADALHLHISANEAEQLRAQHTEVLEAYDAYWRGWVLLESFHADSSYPSEKLIAAEQHFGRALDLDPEYLHPIAGLSMANSHAYFYGVDRTPQRMERAEELAQYVLAIDPDLAEGHIALGLALAIANNHIAAVAEFRAALRLDTDNAIVWCFLAFSCAMQVPPDSKGAEEAAMEAARNLKETSGVLVQIGAAHAGLGNFDEALAVVKLALDRGFKNFDALEGSPYFANLQSDPRFQELIATYK